MKIYNIKMEKIIETKTWNKRGNEGKPEEKNKKKC